MWGGRSAIVAVLAAFVLSIVAPSCSSARVRAYLARRGIALRVGFVGWEAKGLNRLQVRLGQRYRHALKKWFCLGIPAAGICSIAALLLVAGEGSKLLGVAWQAAIAEHNLPWSQATDAERTGSRTAATQHSVPTEASGLQVAVPGSSVPLENVPYLLCAVAVAVVAHEVGHALAAGAEGIPLVATGLFLVGGLLPGAYVSLDSAAIERLSTSAKLRIICAGVWHNVATGAIAMLATKVLPLLLLWGWQTRAGAVVERVSPLSPLKAQLGPGAVLREVQEKGSQQRVCRVNDSAAFRKCIDLAFQPMPTSAYQEGRAVPYQMLINAPHCGVNDIDGDGCKNANELCFRMLSTCGHDKPCEARCLRAKSFATMPTCSLFDLTSADSSAFTTLNQTQGSWGHSPSEQLQRIRRECMAPILPAQDRFLVLLASSHGTTSLRDGGAMSSSVMYVGPREGLSSTFLRLGDYRPRFLFMPLWLPRAAATTLFYLQCVSASMALLNMSPAYGLDGAPAMQAVVYFLLSKFLKTRSRSSATILPLEQFGQGREKAAEKACRSAIRLTTAVTTGILAAVVMQKIYSQLGHG